MLVVAWIIATVFFLVTYTAPCLKVPPAEQLKYFELGGSDQDIFSGIDDTDARGLKHFPRLWCVFWPEEYYFGRLCLFAMRDPTAGSQEACSRHGIAYAARSGLHGLMLLEKFAHYL